MAFVTEYHDSYPFIAPSKFTRKLTGKVVLIAGAGKGIGPATALAFAAAGASVAAVAHTTSDLDTLVAEIKQKHNVPALGITAELLTDPTETIVAQAIATLGPIDILVNNAGIVRMVAFQNEQSLKYWWRVHELNVKVPMGFILAVLPSFIARGSGTLITLGSTAAFASDIPIHRAMEVLDVELRPQGILSYTVHPGFIATGLTAREHTTETEEERLMLAGMLAYAPEVVALPADTIVALAVLRGEDEGVKVLSGRYYDATWDLEKVIGRGSEILEKDLLRLKENGLAWKLDEAVKSGGADTLDKNVV